jgi:hypothetical protein
MDWDALGAIAEAVGAIAIIVSLVYVAAQIRQNNIESGNRIRELLILHPELQQLLSSGFDSYRNLGASEKFRFGMLLRNIFSEIQGAYIRQLSFEHDPLEFEGSARVLDEILLNRGVQEWLEKSEPDWRPAFRKLVDLRLEAIKQQV